MFTLNVFFSPGLSLVASALDQYSGDLRSWKEPFERSIKKVVGPSFRRNFEVGGRPPWEPLSPTTIQIRGSAEPILVRSGRLREVAGQLNIWEIQGPAGEAVLRLSNLPRAKYGIYHQEGTSWMDARPWAVLHPEDVDAIAEEFAAFLEEKGIKRGFVVTRGR